MKKIFIHLFVLLALASCKKVDITFGTEFIDNDNTQIIKIDSFGVDLSTVYLDSFITSNKAMALVGSYTDPAFGKISARTYLQVAPPAFDDIYDNTSFDSLTLIGKANGNYYGDSAQPITLNVSRLSEDIVAPNNGTVLYNVDTFGTYPTLLGSKQVLIRPNSSDTFFVKLPNTLGNELMGMLQRKSDTIKNSTLFLSYFKGLCISSPSASAMILGLNDSLTVRLHYKKAGLFLENRNADFVITNPAIQFNNIKVDRTVAGTALQALNSTTKEISSTATNHLAYSQYITSVVTKMRFPSVKEILKLNNYKKLLKAQLIVRPAVGSYSSLYRLPTELRLARTTQLNLIGDDLTYTNSGGTTASQYGNLLTDYLYGKDTYYTYDVTSYILETIATDGFTQNGLLLLPPSPASETAFNRIVVADKSNGEQKIELQIFYVTVQ